MSSKHIVFILLVFFFLQEVQAQKKELKWSVGGGVGMLNYYGDLSHRFINAKESRLGYNAFIERSINTSLSIRIAYLNGSIEGSDRGEQLIFRNNPANNPTYFRSLNFKTDFHDLNLYLVYNFDNGKIQSKQAKVSPYFFAGFGVGKFSPSADLYNEDGQRYYYWSDKTIRDIDQNDPLSANAQIIELDGIYETNLADLDLETNYSLFKFQVPIGLGLKFKFNEVVRFQLETQFIYTFTDYLDDVSGGSLSDPSDEVKSYAYNPSGLYPDQRGNLNNKLHDGYLYTSGSLVFSFGRKKSKFDGLVVQPIILENAEKIVIQSDDQIKDSTEIKNAKELAYQKSIEAEIAKIEKELAEIKLKREAAVTLEKVESTIPPTNVYNIENQGGNIYIGDHMVVNNSGVNLSEKEAELIDKKVLIATDSLKGVLDSITVLTDAIDADSLNTAIQVKMDTSEIIATDSLKEILDSITVLTDSIDTNTLEIDSIANVSNDTSVLIATDALKSTLDSITVLTDSMEASTLIQYDVSKIDTSGIIATDSLNSVLDSLTLLKDSLEVSIGNQDNVTKVDTSVMIATDALKITLDSSTVIADAIEDFTQHQDDVVKLDTSVMIATDSLKSVLDSINVWTKSLETTSVKLDTIVTLKDSVNKEVDVIEKKLDSIKVESKAADLSIDTVKIPTPKTIVKDTIITPIKEVILIESNNAKQVSSRDSIIEQANKNILALQKQMELQRTLDSIQNLQRDQRIVALENTASNNSQNDSLSNVVNQLNAVTQSNQAAILDSIQALKNIIASYDNSLPKDVFAINDSLIVNNSSKISISKLSDLDSVIINSDNLNNDSTLMTNERYINYLRLDYTLQINTLRLQLEEQLAKLNQSIADNKTDSVVVSSTKESNVYQPTLLDTTNTNKEIIAKLNKLEILLSQVNDTTTIIPATTSISSTNQQGYKQSIDSLKTAMDQRFNLIMEEIKNSKIPEKDSVVSTPKIDLTVKDTAITEISTGLLESIDSITITKDSLEMDSSDFKSLNEIQALRDEITILKESIGQINQKKKQEQDSLYQKIVSAFDTKMEDVVKTYESKTIVTEVKPVETPKPEIIETPKKVEFPPTLRVFFKVNQFTVEAQYFSGLQNISDFVNSNRDVIIVIKGFADASGNAAYNLTLSQKRAENVRDFLIRNFNVDPKSIRVMGLGEVEDGYNPEFSRRVEVTIQ